MVRAGDGAGRDVSAVTLPDAVLQALRASSVAALVGDTYDPIAGTGQVQIGFDYLPPGAALPYVVITQPQEARTYFTAGPTGDRPFLSDGSLAIECHHSDRGTCETLSLAVASALHDNPLSWGTPTNSIMNLRAMGQSFVPTPDVGSGSAVNFLSVVSFAFTYQGAV